MISIFKNLNTVAFIKITTKLLLVLPLLSFSQNLYQEAEENFKRKNFDKAKPVFEQVLKQHPNDKKTREYLGDIAAHQSDWDTALQHYKVLAEMQANDANYHFKYGAALGMKAISGGRFRAISYIWDIKYALERAAELDPNHIETRWALIEYYIQLPGILGGSEKKAVEYADELSKISKVDGYLAKGHIAEFSNRFQDAERYYTKAIEVGGSPHTYERLVKLYEKNSRPIKAIETAAKSLEIHKRNRLNYQIGKICAEFKLKPEYGLACLNEYIANFSDQDEVPIAWAYYRLAQIYKNLGQKEIALSWIDKALLNNLEFEEAQKEKSLISAL